MKTLFLDTNLFLQCRDLKDLPWGKVIETNTELKLLVPRGTQIEIDNFKSQGNSRRSKKARTASTYFRAILESTDNSLIIIDQILIGFPSRRELSTIPLTAGLDTTKNDDLIIQDLIAYRELYPKENATLLSDDTNLIGTAKEYGIPFIFTPDDWKLASEPDTTSKEINNLKEEISRLKRTHPEINITSNLQELKLTIFNYPKLTDDEISSIVDPLLASAIINSPYHNHLANHSSLFSSVFNLPSQQDIDDYNNEKLIDWQHKAENALKLIHRELYNKLNSIKVSFSLSNLGTVPAENLIIQFKASNHLLLLDETECYVGNIKKALPEIPEPPRPRVFGLSQELANAINLHKNPVILNHPIKPSNISRDRNSFYWKSGFRNCPDNYKEASCEEFRHKMAPEEFSLWLTVDQGATPKNGKIDCIVSAKNLPEPKEITIPIKIDYQESSSLKAFHDNYNDMWK